MAQNIDATLDTNPSVKIIRKSLQEKESREVLANVYEHALQECKDVNGLLSSIKTF